MRGGGKVGEGFDVDEGVGEKKGAHSNGLRICFGLHNENADHPWAE